MERHSGEIAALERRFWQAMVDKDAEGAAGMIAASCLVTGPSGAMKLDPERFKAMTQDGKWRLDAFELSDLDVIFPGEGTAVVAYKVHQTGAMKDGPMDLNCADSSVWVREDGGWKCALHTETILQKAN